MAPHSDSTASPQRDDQALRDRIRASTFSIDTLDSAVGDLEQDTAESDAYWIEGAMESITAALWLLVDDPVRPRLSGARLSEVLRWLHGKYAIGSDAIDSIELLERAISGS